MEKWKCNHNKMWRKFLCQQMNYQFSPEEIRVLKECDSEALVQRSIPLSTGFGILTWAAVQRGFLSPSVKYGAVPKVAAAVVFGFFLGKLSYQTQCAEKIMRIPDSRLAQALRLKKKGAFYENFGADGSLSVAPFSSSTDVYTDENMKSHQQNSLDLDVDRPANFGLDDTFRPNLDSPDRSFNDNLPLEPPKSSTSYEELRRKNREQYDQRLQAPFNRTALREEAPIINRPLAERDESFQQGGAGPRNRYGDAWK